MLGGGQLFGNRQVEPGPAGDQRIGHMPILVEIIGVIAGNVEDERRRVPQFVDDGYADKQGRNRQKPHESKSLPSAGRVKRDTPQARSRLQTAIISNTKAMASTRIQLMTNGTRTLARASVTGTIAPRSS